MGFKGLFVGIDRYASPLISNLSCAVRDAQALYGLFSDSLGTSSSTLLINEQATKAGVIRAVQDLHAQPDDVVVLAFEEDRDLTKHPRIADRIEPKHIRTTSSRRRRRKIFLHRREDKRRGREWNTPDERTAFEKELQLAHGEAHDPRGGLAPQAGKATALEPLGVDAEAGAVPQEHLGPLARGIHEQVAIAGERIVAQPLAHEPAQPVEAFTQIGGPAIGPHRDLPCGADHESARRTATSVSPSSPSMRKPCGVTSTMCDGRSGADADSGTMTTGRTAIGPGRCSQSASVGNETPTARATWARDWPCATRVRASAMMAARKAAG